MPHLSRSRPIEAEFDDLLTTSEAAKFLKISKAALLNMCCNGTIPYYKLGRRNRFRRSELGSLLLKNKKGG